MRPIDDKQYAVDLLSRLDAIQFAAVIQLLEVMVPHDEESDTLSPAERKAVTEADEWLRDHEPIPNEQVLAEFGLTMNDWEKMAEEPAPEVTSRRHG